MDEKHFLELKGVRESLGYACFALSKAIDEFTGTVKEAIKNVLPKN